MVNNRQTRAIEALQKAKGNGIKEIDLIGYYDSGDNTRKIKSRMCKDLGDRHAVTTENGVWKLDPAYWDLSRIEIQYLMLFSSLEGMKQIIFYSFFTAIFLAILLGLIAGSMIEFKYA